MIETDINIKTKLPGFNNSIFAIMTQLANEYNALNLSQGFPDFNTSSPLIEKVQHYIEKGENQYAPMKGIYKLRQQINKKYDYLYSRKYDPEAEITITAGATQAIFSVITAFVAEDDEVIIIEPAFDTYAPSVLFNGGIVKFAQTEPPNFQIDWEKVQRMISARTKLIILNFPNNPTGRNIQGEDLNKLNNLIRNTDIIIMSDEVYEHILFDHYQHISLATHENLSKRSLIISSFGKSYTITGWKLGYCVGPEKLTKEFRKAHQNIVFAANRPMQLALADFMEEEDHDLGLQRFYQQKRDFFISAMEKSRFKIIPSQGTFYQLADFSKISDRSDYDFAIELTKTYKVASVPLSAFYNNKQDHKILRFCFAKSDETLKKATDILCSI
ncbi:MAG: aminotransferase class I/II-fold pyridoxal phosphate-dependent enzyme [Bacteroidales bacterium]|nr:aminotransferase class I/II-fold pyridoxal phosphate-dependent enzyme [Bacteroidales bacterium]